MTQVLRELYDLRSTVHKRDLRVATLFSIQQDRVKLGSLTSSKTSAYDNHSDDCISM